LLNQTQVDELKEETEDLQKEKENFDFGGSDDDEDVMPVKGKGKRVIQSAKSTKAPQEKEKE
jgi:hypothetical protein